MGKNVKIQFVKDRPGHDMRYAIDSTKIKKKIKWMPKISFINGLNKCGIAIDRKILAEIAYDSPEAFKKIVQKAQSALN